MSNSTSPSSASTTDTDRATGRLPTASADDSAELALGDDDIIADGGTQIMSREPGPPAEAALPTCEPALVSKAPSSLDDLAAMIPVKHTESKFAAPRKDVPPAPKTEPIDELDPDDLEEEELRRNGRTQPFDRARLFGALASRVQTPSAAWQPAPPPRPDHVVSPMPPPVLGHASAHLPMHPPSVVIHDAAPPQNRPASIAPLAIDVAPPARAMPDTTLMLAAVPHAPGVPKSNAAMIAASIGGGLALCAAAVIALASFASMDGSEASSKSAPTVAAKPREAQKGAVRSAVIETPETTPLKAEAKPGAPDEDGTPVYSPSVLPSAPAAREHSGSAWQAAAPSVAQTTPSFRAPSATTMSHAVKPSAPAAQAAPVEPAPPPTAAAPPPPPPSAPRPAAPPPTTGTIEVPGSLMTVMIDGDYRRVQSGRIVVTCGKHRVNAGRGTQLVDVPCGGVASVM